MRPLLFSFHLRSLLLLVIFDLFLTSSPFNYCPSLEYEQKDSPYANLTIDFGRIIIRYPAGALLPKSPQDISGLLKSISSSPTQNNVTVGPRGAGHSIYGQAQAPNGVVVDMRSLTPNLIQVQEAYVDAAGGVLWVDLLQETLKRGLAPRSWTDYLHITVGGTLSNAGISGQTYKFGPQISNVIELDVLTGNGDIVTCSENVNSDLFNGVLGGLGQFGIITRARIVLERAPQRAKRVKVPYVDFDQFTADQEKLINSGDVNYLEGFVSFGDNNSSSNTTSYTLEFVIYYDNEGDAQKTLDQVLSKLQSKSKANITDISYFDFLNRVRTEELALRAQGLWEVPHPWLIFFVPRDQIGRFKDLLLQTILDPSTPFGGIVAIYPTLKDKWNPNMSVVLPQTGTDGIFYIVNVLRSTASTCISGSPCIEAYLSQNKKIIDAASGMGTKQYLPYYEDQTGWINHFGEKWGTFQQLKSKFDPLHILAPGQRIFERKPLQG